MQQFLRRPDGTPRSPAEMAGLWAAERERCRRNPLYQLRQWAWIRDPHAEDPYRRLIPLLPWPGQVKLVGFLLQGLRQGRDRQVNKGRKLGVSWLACALIHWLWSTEHGFQALLGSRVEDLVDDRTPESLFGKVRSVEDTLPVPLRAGLVEGDSDKYMHLEHPRTGSIISGESTNRGFGRGGRQAVVLTDELAHVHPALQRRVKLSLQTVARTWWKISTPNGKGDVFHLDWLTAQERDRLEINWRTDPRRTEAWFAGLLTGADGEVLTWDERAQEHDCSFAGVSGERVWAAERDRISYTDDTEEGRWPLARRDWLLVVAMDFGSGPSLAAAIYLLVNWDQDADHLPTVRLDYVQTWQRRAAAEIGADIRSRIEEDYGHNVYVVGDPAGRAAESDQESWESRLQAAGVPVRCLPSEYNDPVLIRESLIDVQRLLDAGRLKIHAERSAIALETVESWKWDIPDGMPLDLVNKAEIRPRKDVWSHPGDAIRYGVETALRLRVDSQVEGVIRQLPPTAGGEIADLYSRLLG